MGKNGQSTFEYVLIATIVILGVFFMGPYVLRSVNAHFKLWDIGVQESATEHLSQAPVNSVPDMPLNCSCSPAVKGSCGGNTAGSFCPVGEREYYYNCTPVGCNGAGQNSSCQKDDSCCVCPVPTGCGSAPLPTSGIGSCPAITDSTTNTAANCSLPSSTCSTPQGSGAAGPNNCYYGYQIYRYQCGANAGKIECVQDSQCPQPACLGILSPGAVACPGAPGLGGSPLSQNVGITYVNGQNSCDPSQQVACQYYCDNTNSYFLIASGAGCSRTFQVAPVPSWPGNVWTTVTNDQSFTICSNNSPSTGQAAVITGVSVAASPPGQTTSTPISVSGDGCQNNAGEPGTQCQVTVNY